MIILLFESVVAQGHKCASVNATRQNTVLSYASHHAMPQEFAGKWETEVSECRMEVLNIKFLPTLLCAGYSVTELMRLTMVFD